MNNLTVPLKTFPWFTFAMGWVLLRIFFLYFSLPKWLGFFKCNYFCMPGCGNYFAIYAFGAKSISNGSANRFIMQVHVPIKRTIDLPFFFARFCMQKITIYFFISSRNVYLLLLCFGSPSQFLLSLNRRIQIIVCM